MEVYGIGIPRVILHGSAVDAGADRERRHDRLKETDSLRSQRGGLHATWVTWLVWEIRNAFVRFRMIFIGLVTNSRLLNLNGHGLFSLATKDIMHIKTPLE